MAEQESAGGLNRRNVLLGGAAAGVGVAAGVIGADRFIQSKSGADSISLNGDVSIEFFGKHQKGVYVAPQAHANLIALNLKSGIGKPDLVRMMRVLSDDAARLMAGRAPLADTEPELSYAPARLTVVFGFGPGFVKRAGVSAPWLAQLPAFEQIDKLEKRWSEGDLLVEVAADDPTTVAHATRMLLKDSRSFAKVHWLQQGFRHSNGTFKPGTTMRNLFGQVDGTVNPKPGTPEFDKAIWRNDGWMAGGTTLVVRRIAMDLDKWDELDRPGRELAVGRKLANGAPLTGKKEFDQADFAAVGPDGLKVIPEFAHIRRGHNPDPQMRMLRRGLNYDDAPGDGGVSNSGLIFTAYQADIATQFIPVQKSLAEMDLLNQWTTPIGSAVFALPPGCAEGGFIGETLLA